MKIKDLIQSISKHVLDIGFLFSQIFIPLGVLSIYSASLFNFLPEGVNKVFVERTAKIAIPITIFLLISFMVYFSITGLRKIKPKLFSTAEEKFYPSDLILPLLPLTPLVQYMINNSDILSWFECLIIFSLFLVLVSLPIFVVPRLFLKTGSTRPVMFLGMALSFLIINMASMTAHYKWYQEGSFLIQLLVLGSIWLLSWVLDNLKFRSLLYLFIAVNFVSNSIIQFVNLDDTKSPSARDQTDNPLIMLIDSREPAAKPSIYLLIYDSYVVNETMIEYGIDNQEQQQYLRELDFNIYPDVYSLGTNTLDSMSRVFNNSMNYYGNKRRGISGDGVVQNLLKEFGYKTYGVFSSDYYARGVVPTYDYSFPDASSPVGLLSKAIFLGELRFDLNFSKITQQEYIHEKEIILSEVTEDPRFVYMHSVLPGHSQNSGVCRPDEIELFRDRLAQANIEMRQDIALVIEHDPEAILIVAGDHGPHLTKNCLSYLGNDYDISEITRLDIQDRYGTFVAIKWPSADFVEYDDITILQDLFPSIFAYIFEDQGLLESRIEPETDIGLYLSGVEISDGTIVGGVDDGEPLFP